MKRILAICDTEEEYVRKLMRYLNECGQIPFEVQAYTNWEVFLEVAKENPPVMLLISLELMNSSVRDLGIEKIVLLSQGEPIEVFGEYPFIVKYQAASGIMREVMHCYMGSIQAVSAIVGVNQCRIFGVYSPVKRCGKTSFSLALAGVYASKKRVLYLNLEGQSGFSHLLKESGAADITDALYYFRQQRENGLERILSMIRQMDSFFYIPPAFYEEDVKSVDGQEWETFLKLMEEKSGYEGIILDIGDAVRGIGRILNVCDEIFMPIKEDLFSQAKLSEGMEALTASGFGELKKRMIPIRMEEFVEKESGDIWNIIKNENYQKWVREFIEEIRLEKGRSDGMEDVEMDKNFMRRKGNGDGNAASAGIGTSGSYKRCDG